MARAELLSSGMSCAPAYEQSCGVSRRESPDRGGTANYGRSATLRPAVFRMARAELLSNGVGAQQSGTACGFPNGTGMKKGGYIAATFSL